MPTITYPLDMTGLAASNLVVDELHTVNESQFRDYFFIVPLYAPFYTDNFSLSLISNSVETPLTPGVEFDFALPYVAGVRATGKLMYGAITLNNLTLDGILKMSYQTIGGDIMANRLLVLQTLAEKVYNPRITIWDIVTDRPDVFPPVPHYQDFDQFYSQEDLINAINQIPVWLAANRNEVPIVQHLGDFDNPHQTTLTQLGYQIASLLDLTNGTYPDRLVNSQVLAPVLEDIRVSIQDLQSSLDAFHPAPRLKGPSSVQVGAEPIFRINDYDSYIPYNINTTVGSVSRDEDRIHLRAMDSIATVELTVNGRLFTIPVAAGEYTEVLKHEPAAPISGGKFGLHIAVNTAVDAMVVASPNETVSAVANKGRVRYYKKIAGAWTLQQTVDCPGANQLNFGQRVFMTSDGLYLFISAPNHTGGLNGVVYAYQLVSGTWVLASQYTQGVALDGFGSAMQFNGDQSLMAISAPNLKRVYIYGVSGSVLTLRKTIVPSSDEITSSTKYGESLGFDNLSNMLIIGNPSNINSSGALIGSVDIYQFNTNANGLFRIGGLNIPIRNNVTGYGRKVALSRGGAYAAIACTITVSGTPYQAVQILKRTPQGWIEDAFIQSPQANTRLGEILRFMNDDTLLAGEPDYAINDDTVTNKSGVVTVIQRQSNQWQVMNRFTSNTPEHGSAFGEFLIVDDATSTIIAAAPNATVSSVASVGAVYFLQ